MTTDGGGRVRTTRLDNGLVVVTEAMPHVRTASFAVFQLHGSRDETADQNGLSHFLEHFVFRGTEPRAGSARGRSAREIAIETDLMGGDLEAATTREETSYWAEVPADRLVAAIDLVTDLVGRPALPAEDLERERSVIREELKSYEDSPDDVVTDLSAARLWPEHPLGRPIQGTLERVEAISASDLRDFWATTATGGNVLCCAAGLLDHEEVVRRVDAGLGHLPAGGPLRGPEAPSPGRGAFTARRDHLEQAQLVLSLPGLPQGHPDETALDVLVTAVGGGLSSRLWQRVREEEGLAYDVSLGTSALRDTGRVVFDAASAPENVVRVLEIFEEEAERAGAGDLGPEGFEHAVGGLAASLVLGLEGPSARVEQLAEGQLVHGRHVSLDEELAQLEAVTPEQVFRLAREVLLDGRRNLVVLGPDDTPEITVDSLGGGAIAAPDEPGLR